MHIEPGHAVAAFGGFAAAVGLVAPGHMCLLWPADPKRDIRLMQAWSLSTFGLTATLVGVRPERAIAAVCLASVPWDLAWGGTMGKAAALLNLGCVCLLVKATGALPARA